MEYKLCSKCKKNKPISEFYLRGDPWGGYHKTCKDCWYKIGKAWKSKNLQRFYKAQRKYMLTPKGYYTRLKCGSRYSGVEFLITRDEFIDWFNNQKMNCHYCGQPLIRYSGRIRFGNTFTLDRKDNQKGYDINNIVVCCLTCNKIKADTFNETEMLQIANMFIKPKLVVAV